MSKKTSPEKTSFSFTPSSKPEVKKEVKTESSKVRPGSFASLISQ